MNLFLVFIASRFLFGGAIDISKEKEHREPGVFNARAASVYVSGNDVYVAGYQHSENSKTVVKLWKNGIGQNFSDGTGHAFATSVFVSGNDVYVAGCEETSESYVPGVPELKSCTAKLWKNGVAQNLSSKKADHAVAYSVFVSGDDVYVAGMEYKRKRGSLRSVAKLWKNGVAQNLDGCDGIAQSVFVSGNDVYVAGSGNDECPSNADSQVAKLWKNGAVQNLSDTAKVAWAHSVYVSGGDVYVAGVEYQGLDGQRLIGGTPVLWKNGIARYMDMDSIMSSKGCNDVTGSAGSVSVSESGNVYVAGFVTCNSRETFSVLWKNGIVQQLTEEGAFNFVVEHERPNSVFVCGEDVYLAGSDDRVLNAVIWKNGILQKLTENRKPELDYENFIIR